MNGLRFGWRQQARAEARAIAKVRYRDYQVDGCDAVVEQLEKVSSTLLVMPTGCGKTLAFAALAQHYRCDGHVLVLVHREVLAVQAKEKIEATTDLTVGIEMGDQRVDPNDLPDVVVASVQTLARDTRRVVFRPNDFALIVIDEAHHAASDSFATVFDYFKAKRVGVTATPDRSDGTGMRGAFESVAFVYEIRTAIEQGHLVPIRQKRLQVESLDLSAVRMVAGDLNQGDLERVFAEERVHHEMADPLLVEAGRRPTMVFVPSVANAVAFADVLNRHRPGCAVALSGQTDRDEQKVAIAAFAEGKFQFLVNCALLTEGFDAPFVSCVAIARPTKSRSLYTQMAGRGTRLSPDTGKRDLLVLDFVGNAGRHSLICTADILDGSRDEKVRDRAVEIMERDQIPVHEALDLAAEQIAAEKRAAVTAKARYRTVDVDPFVVLGASDVPGRHGGMAPTDKQILALENSGIDTHGLDRGQASALIDKIFDRRRRGLCTFKQARQLAKYGLNPDVTFDAARRAMDAIASNGWRAPPWLYEEPAFRIAVEGEATA